MEEHMATVFDSKTADDAYRAGYEAGYQACRRSKRRVEDPEPELLTKVDTAGLVNEIREIAAQLRQQNEILVNVIRAQHWA